MINSIMIRGSLGDLSERYADDVDLNRLIDIALSDISRYKPLLKASTLTIVANQQHYDMPADFLGYKSNNWGMAQRSRLEVWDDNYPKKLPRVTIIGDEQKQLALSFPPSSSLIAQCSAQFNFIYKSNHIHTGDGQTTFDDDSLLLLRVQIEALNEAMLDRITKNVSTHDVVSNQAKNGTPAALREQLMKDFYRRVLL